MNVKGNPMNFSFITKAFFVVTALFAGSFASAAEKKTVDGLLKRVEVEKKEGKLHRCHC